ncbi:MAG: hypothetical protein U0841_16770 [Chloroflexia bacterium]
MPANRGQQRQGHAAGEDRPPATPPAPGRRTLRRAIVAQFIVGGDHRQRQRRDQQQRQPRQPERPETPIERRRQRIRLQRPEVVPSELLIEAATRLITNPMISTVTAIQTQRTMRISKSRVAAPSPSDRASPEGHQREEAEADRADQQHQAER